MATEILPAAGALKGGVHCDVAVVGSGIAGISTAYQLCKRDQSIIVIDRKGIVSGMTARTSAHLAPLCDDLMSECRKLRGAENAKLVYESQAAGVDRPELTFTLKLRSTFSAFSYFGHMLRSYPATPTRLCWPDRGLNSNEPWNLQILAISRGPGVGCLPART
ncbi:FAD-dependent oxidoreductase [Bradyrhizobium barranii]|jgi:glycine/D-amino acid oxidase-like deaminating enzyme|uniref:FAD-dependent oxidoreductase n=1 Tax=Bradyrhizobium TaxID=374 RepID=UPI003F2164B3